MIMTYIRNIVSYVSHNHTLEP